MFSPTERWKKRLARRSAATKLAGGAFLREVLPNVIEPKRGIQAGDRAQ
jgi:hypothetical protein